MEYCESCGYHLQPQTSKGELVFFCEKCNKPYDSTAEQTLRSHIDFEASETTEKYEVMESLAPFDTAGKRVPIPCIQCKKPFMVQIYEGANYMSKYICSCGYTTTKK